MPKKKIDNPFGTLEESIKYQPYGMLCNTCEHMYRSCNHLPFNTMPVHKKDTENFLTIVRCTEHQPNDT